MDDREYVIRTVTSTEATSFAKEQFIFERLLSAQIPVPQILHRGQTDEFHVAITPKMPGVTVDRLSQADHDAVVPKLVALLDAIHQSDVSRCPGYGYFDETGVGWVDSWPAHLIAVAEEEDDDSFFGRWHALFDETFLERDLFYRLFERMTDLLAGCPDERRLLHGDYGSDNVLVDQGRVSAILDWSQAQFGDPLYEAARLEFWAPRTPYRAGFQAHYQAQQRSMPAFAERLACYQTHVTLDAMRFFAKIDNKGAYDYVLQRAQELGVLNGLAQL